MLLEEYPVVILSEHLNQTQILKVFNLKNIEFMGSNERHFYKYTKPAQ